MRLPSRPRARRRAGAGRPRPISRRLNARNSRLATPAALGSVIAAVLLSAAGVALAPVVTHRAPATDAAMPATTPVVLPVADRTTAASRSQLRPAPPLHYTHPQQPVSPLRSLTAPDVLVELGFAATPAQVDRLRHAAGVQAVAVLDAGKVRTPFADIYAVGVDPSEFRGFTPRLTAQSDALWQSVARGEMAVANSYAGRMGSRFGGYLPVKGGVQQDLRLGAFASFGIPGAEAVVDRATARAIGLSPDHRLLIAAPRLSLDELRALARGVLGQGVQVDLLRPAAIDQSEMSDYAAEVIPTAYLRLYRAAASTCPGLPWTVLAAIGAVETGHGSNTAVSSAGAEGPMQFLPSTWRYYGRDADGDGVANIDDPVDAIYSAAGYLCANGAGRGGQSLYDAIFAYNHADWYVRDVIRLALLYQ